MFRKLILMLAIALTIFAVNTAFSYPPADNQWSEIIDYGFTLTCPGSNPVQTCQVHVRYQVKRNVVNGVFQSGDIKIIDMEISENCPCALSMYAGALKALMETEAAFLRPVRIANEIFELTINFMTTSPCVAKYYYYRGIVKYYRWVPCEETEECINQYTATYQQNQYSTSNALAELVGANLDEEASFDACTSPCTSWCGNFSIDGAVLVGIDYEKIDNYTRYEGPLTYDPSPKISIPIQLSDLSILPNPAKDKIEITFNSLGKGNLEIKLIDLLGNTQTELSNTINVGTFNSTIDSKDIPNGAYTLVITLDGNLVAAEKILIER